jgi:hypothetical protein
MDPHLDIRDFNEKGELKTPVGLVLALLFLSRHFLFLLLAGLSEFMVRGAGFDVASLGLPPAWSLLIDVPLFGFLLIVLRKEKLSAGGLLRRILRKGVPLLVSLAVLQLFLLTALDYLAMKNPGLLQMADTVLMGVCIFYLTTNWKVRLFFREYGG